jgi:hypothetical protein
MTSYERQELREEIATTRAELGDTIEALAEKMDVKSRMAHAATDARQRIRTRSQELAKRTRATARETVHQAAVLGRRYRVPLIAIAVSAVALGAVVAARRRRR